MNFIRTYTHHVNKTQVKINYYKLDNETRLVCMVGLHNRRDVHAATSNNLVVIRIFVP